MPHVGEQVEHVINPASQPLVATGSALMSDDSLPRMMDSVTT